jgi:hypothetical protein
MEPAFRPVSVPQYVPLEDPGECIVDSCRCGSLFKRASCSRVSLLQPRPSLHHSPAGDEPRHDERMRLAERTAP